MLQTSGEGATYLDVILSKSRQNREPFRAFRDTFFGGLI
jgi:hypothetical protein